jgi:hypothetical protein
MSWLTKNWWLWILGVLGVAIAMKSDIAPTAPAIGEPSNLRSQVAFQALSEVGNKDPSKFWRDVLPGQFVFPPDWCGAFVLWALHQVGLAKNWSWIIGKGFLYRLPITKTPQIGDMAYFNHNQHHAVVSSVNNDGTVSLVNGNGTGGAVSTSKIPVSQVTAFYSISPLLPKVAA